MAIPQSIATYLSPAFILYIVYKEGLMSLIGKFFHIGNGNGNGNGEKKKLVEELEQYRMKEAFGQVLDAKLKEPLDQQTVLLTEIRDDLKLALFQGLAHGKR